MINKKSISIPNILLIAFIGFLFLNCQGTSPDDSKLKSEFLNPPNSAKPRVWWHWMNGNITKDGIQKDLEWMDRIGIGGFQNFDANLFTPVIVSEPLVFMTPEWKDAFKFTANLANEKGLEMAIAGSPGWSVTGGPWVEPKDAMKKFVWTETRIKGGKTFSGILPQPSDNLGKYQNAQLASAGITGGFIGDQPKYYADAMVVAYKLPEKDMFFTELNPKVSSSGGNFTLSQLTDLDLNNAVFLPPVEVGKDMWIQYEFTTPQTFKAFSISGSIENMLAEFNGGPENRSLKVSDDGKNFRVVAKVSGSTVPFNTVSIEPTTSKYWRICFETLPSEPNMFAAMAGLPSESKPDGVNVSEFLLYNTDRIDQIEDKAGFSPWKENYSTSLTNSSDVIAESEIVDLTTKMSADGTLNWEVPEGNWMVMRLGSSLTGRQNHPASPAATGLEVDKLDKAAVGRYINTYLDMYKDATGGLMGEKGLGFMILDSYEAGHMNWTNTLPTEFKNRRGYDLVSWIPVLSGRIIKDVASSEKFLWDFRKTIGELISENHYDVIGDELHKRKMKRYTESHEGGRIYLADGMDVKRNADIPMSAMWTPGSLAGGSDEEVRSEADIRESASVANIYGKPFVAAESMTSIQNAFSFHPEKLKRTADLELASGLNRFVIHTSVHQPLDDKKPGFSLGPFGQYFTRHETWAEYAKPWMDYLARSSYMLQQGSNIADVLYYYGENTNITWICREKLPEIPQGHEFDFVNATALLNAFHVKDGKLVAKSGNKYELLMLDESAQYMTLPVLQQIKTYVEAGIKLVGNRPVRSPSLSDNDEEFQKIADELWQNENIIRFENANLHPDVIITKTKSKILFRHRQTASQDIYWLNNRNELATDAEISFRISGKVPELFDPQTGKTNKISYRKEEGRTIIPLKFESWGAFFIVFNGKTNSDHFDTPEKVETHVLEVGPEWRVKIGGKQIQMDNLSSWSENDDPAIKYFSGTASYSNNIELSEKEEGAEYILKLGSVNNLVEVIVNGKNMGILWKKPFKMDITEALQKGQNGLEFNVTNLWVNRLIGDAQPNAEKTTFTTMPFYQAEGTLLSSGLLGPVILTKNTK